jgi:hypothetical protein
MDAGALGKWRSAPKQNPGTGEGVMPGFCANDGVLAGRAYPNIFPFSTTPYPHPLSQKKGGTPLSRIGMFVFIKPEIRYIYMFVLT